MTPTIGRIVHFRPADGDTAARNNYSDSAAEVILPAIITRVWSDTCVNLTIFPDNAAPFTRTSVTFGEAKFGWEWPPRA